MTSKLNAPVFVVGLERLKEQRYQRVLDALTAIGVDATVWPAVDGAQPIKYEPGEAVARFKLQHYATAGRGLFKTEIGCYLSHWRLWRRAFEQNNCERVFVLEDDAVFDAAHFKEALANLAKLDQSFEYIQLKQERCDEVGGQPLTKDGAYALYKLARWYMNHTYGYAISRQGFKKLAPALTPIKTTIDGVLIHNHRKTKLRIWTVAPSLVRQDPSLASSIRPARSRTELARLRYRRLVKFTLAPIHWIYIALISADWTLAQQDADAMSTSAARVAYAKTLTKALFQTAFKGMTRSALGTLVYRFLRGGVRRD